jgi:hypothetical protein
MPCGGQSSTLVSKYSSTTIHSTTTHYKRSFRCQEDADMPADQLQQSQVDGHHQMDDVSAHLQDVPEDVYGRFAQDEFTELNHLPAAQHDSAALDGTVVLTV